MINTINFIPIGKETENMAPRDNVQSGTYIDIRNSISCKDPSIDFESYLNYIRLLNRNRDLWRNYGYLDLGMIPVVMAPSFIHDKMYELMLPFLNQLGIDIYTMPPVSLMNSVCRIPGQDIWVFRDDAAKLMGIPINEVSTEKFIRWCLKI